MKTEQKAKAPKEKPKQNKEKPKDQKQTKKQEPNKETKTNQNKKQNEEQNKQSIKLIKQKPNEIKSNITEETINKIFYNLIRAIIFMIYFLALIITYEKANQYTELLIRIPAAAMLLAGLIYLEKSYQKDEGKSLLISIELFIMSIHTLAITYITTKFNFNIQIYIIAVSYIFAIYQTLKSIIIYTKERKDYLNNLSDVKEIVKKEKPVKKEATKKTKKEVK